MPPNNAEQPITSDSSASPDDTATAVAPIATKPPSHDMFPEADVSSENGATGMDEPQDFPVTDARPLHEEQEPEPEEQEKKGQVPEQVQEIPENHHQHDQLIEPEQVVETVEVKHVEQHPAAPVSAGHPTPSGPVPQVPTLSEAERRIQELEQQLALFRVSDFSHYFTTDFSHR